MQIPPTGFCVHLLPPANEVCEGYVFTGVCLSKPGGGGRVWFYLGGMHGFIGGHAWFYLGGGMRGFIRGACMVLFGGVGMRGFIRGACIVLFGGVPCYYSEGACVVLFGGHAWFYSGGRAWFFQFFGYNEIRSMSGRYASYWNAFLLVFVSSSVSVSVSVWD